MTGRFPSNSGYKRIVPVLTIHRWLFTWRLPLTKGPGHEIFLLIRGTPGCQLPSLKNNRHDFWIPPASRPCPNLITPFPPSTRGRLLLVLLHFISGVGHRQSPNAFITVTSFPFQNTSFVEQKSSPLARYFPILLGVSVP